jgi:hypothetical protein
MDSDVRSDQSATALSDPQASGFCTLPLHPLVPIELTALLCSRAPHFAAALGLDGATDWSPNATGDRVQTPPAKMLKDGEPVGIRTRDLLIKSQLLYRLSYGLGGENQ